MTKFTDSANHYEILSVPEYASADAIREAYVAQVRKLKKDKDQDDWTQEDRRAILDEAYSVLSEERSRTEYDRLLLHELKSIPGMDDPGPRGLSANYHTDDNEMYREGLEHLENERFDQAAVCFRKMVQFERKNPVLLKLLAKAYLGSGTIAFAEQAVERAVELEADDWENCFLLGQIRERQNKLGAARKYYRQAYRLNPRNRAVIAQYNRGSLITERAVRAMKLLLVNFKPDPAANSFRLSDGLISRDAALRFFDVIGGRLAPIPARYSFRCTGLF